MSASNVVQDFKIYFKEKTKHCLITSMIPDIFEKLRENDFSLFTEDTWKEIVSFAPIVYEIIPNEQKTKNLTLHTIKCNTTVSDDRIIKSMPLNLFDEEVMTLILDKHKLDIILFPLKYLATTCHFGFTYNKIREICRHIVTRESRYAPGWYESIFSRIPDNYKDKSFLEEAIDIDPSTFRYFPKHLITHKMCYKASLVKDKYSVSLKDVPYELRTANICINFYVNNPYNIQYFPLEYIDSELVLDAVNRDPLVIKVIPQVYLTQKFCDDVFDKAHVKNHSTYKVFECIPLQFRTKDMADKMIKTIYSPTCKATLVLVPDKYKDEIFWTNFLTNDEHGYYILAKHVPANYHYLLSEDQLREYNRIYPKK